MDQQQAYMGISDAYQCYNAVHAGAAPTAQAPPPSSYYIAPYAHLYETGENDLSKERFAICTCSFSRNGIC